MCGIVCARILAGEGVLGGSKTCRGPWVVGGGEQEGVLMRDDI